MSRTKIKICLLCKKHTNIKNQIYKCHDDCKRKLDTICRTCFEQHGEKDSLFEMIKYHYSIEKQVSARNFMLVKEILVQEMQLNGQLDEMKNKILEKNGNNHNTITIRELANYYYNKKI